MLHWCIGLTLLLVGLCLKLDPTQAAAPGSSKSDPQVNKEDLVPMSAAGMPNGPQRTASQLRAAAQAIYNGKPPSQRPKESNDKAEGRGSKQDGASDNVGPSVTDSLRASLECFQQRAGVQSDQVVSDVIACFVFHNASVGMPVSNSACLGSMC